MDIPRAKYPKLGVFLHPDVLKKVEKKAGTAGVSMTRYVEKLVIEAVSNGKQVVQSSPRRTT